MQPLDAFFEVEYEVSKLIEVSFPRILNSEMLKSNAEMIEFNKNWKNNASNLPKLIEDLESIIKLIDSPEEPNVPHL